MDETSTSISVIGADVSVIGTLEGDEELVICGTVEGDITLRGRLIIEEGGAVKANIQAEDVQNHGAVLGNIDATESITLAETSRTVGNIQAPRISILEGAQYRGQVDMGKLGIAAVPQKPALQAVSKPAASKQATTKRAAPATRTTAATKKTTARSAPLKSRHRSTTRTPTTRTRTAATTKKKATKRATAKRRR